MLIAGNSKILQIAGVYSDLDRVATASKRPVIDKLKLLHFFDQWTVAVVVQRVPKIKPALSESTSNSEVGHTLRSGVIGKIQSGSSSVFRKGARSQGIDEN